MKIAYFGYNPFSSCLAVFTQTQYNFEAIFTGRPSAHSDQIIDFAYKHAIPLYFEKPTATQMQSLVNDGVELFFSAEYPWKIPLPNNLKYAINVHPTMLPEGRGQTPLPTLILEQSKHAGVTLHKLSDEFDRGDILLQHPISLDEHENFDSLSNKVSVKTSELLGYLLSDLASYYQRSKAQESGSDWPKLKRAQQTLDWQRPTHEVLKIIRAFGSLGTYADIQNHHFIITQASGRLLQHGVSAGEVLSNDQHQLAVATTDGMVSIPKSSILSLKVPE
jgi:methionyl-tRNA formyltransferase